MSKQFTNFFMPFLVMVIFCFSHTSNAQVTTKIIGGSRANSFAWPWMAGLVFKNFTASNALFCGASLIADDWVLTAAHCVLGEDSSSFDVIINRAQLGIDSGVRLSVSSIIIHPSYNFFTNENDLALVKLASPSVISPIQILSPNSFQDDAGKIARALGWGTTFYDSTVTSQTAQLSDSLQQVDLPLITNARCATSLASINDPDLFITDGMLCAGDGISQKDTCIGDSGGPLLVFDTERNKWRQAGITSFGIGCAQRNFFGVYTRLEQYAQFISDTICHSTEIPAPVSLSLDIQNNLATASWSETNIASGYRLNYAPFPQGTPVFSFDMNQLKHFSINLPSGSAYYVAITSYNNNCLSEFSNIEHFIIN